MTGATSTITAKSDSLTGNDSAQTLATTARPFHRKKGQNDLLMTKNDGKRRIKARNSSKWLSIVLPCYPQPAQATRNEKLKTNNEEHKAIAGTTRTPFNRR